MRRRFASWSGRRRTNTLPGGGLLLDICRAIGAAVLPPDGRLEFNQYDSSTAFDAVRNGTDDIFFLSASEIIEENLAGKIVPGPAVFYQSISVMVPKSSKPRHLTDLAGEPVCFILGGNADNNIEAWFAHHNLDFVRMGYQEDVEMYDAYNAQVCHAMAAEATTLRRSGSLAASIMSAAASSKSRSRRFRS